MIVVKVVSLIGCTSFTFVSSESPSLILAMSAKGSLFDLDSDGKALYLRQS